MSYVQVNQRSCNSISLCDRGVNFCATRSECESCYRAEEGSKDHTVLSSLPECCQKSRPSPSGQQSIPVFSITWVDNLWSYTGTIKDRAKSPNPNLQLRQDAFSFYIYLPDNQPDSATPPQPLLPNHHWGEGAAQHLWNPFHGVQLDKRWRHRQTVPPVHGPVPFAGPCWWEVLHTADVRAGRQIPQPEPGHSRQTQEWGTELFNWQLLPPCGEETTSPKSLQNYNSWQLFAYLLFHFWDLWCGNFTHCSTFCLSATTCHS